MVDKNYTLTRYACYSANVSMAAVASLSPLLFMTFRRLYGLSYSMLGALVLIGFCTQLLMDLVFSFWAHKFNITAVVRVMPALTAAGLISYALLPFFFPDYAAAGIIVGSMIFSASGGIAEVFVSPVLAALPSKTPDRDMSRLHSMYAWGVVAVAILSTLYLKAFGDTSWHLLALLWAIVPLCSLVLFLRAPIPQLSTEKQAAGAFRFAVKGKTLCLLALTALFGQPALANEPQHTPPATDQRTAVLGQPRTGTLHPAPEEKAKKDAQALFEESLRQMMPLDESQIQEYRSRSDERDRALLPVSPTLNTRTVRVTLEPGRSPVAVFTTANIATSLVFHDSTGQPWPITSVTNGGPSFFQVLRPELPDGNLLNVMPTQGYATSSIVVTLQDRDIPLVIRLESDSVRAPERKADALVLFQLAHHGPKASVPITKDIRETADSSMLAFLDRVPPEQAARVRVEPGSDDVLVWSYNGKHYVRTIHSLMWPAWTAVVNGAGNTRCYEIPITSRLMISRNGQIQTIRLQLSK